jgi:hypothetical protein
MPQMSQPKWLIVNAQIAWRPTAAARLARLWDVAVRKRTARNQRIWKIETVSLPLAISALRHELRSLSETQRRSSLR